MRTIGLPSPANRRGPGGPAVARGGGGPGGGGGAGTVAPRSGEEDLARHAPMVRAGGDDRGSHLACRMSEGVGRVGATQTDVRSDPPPPRSASSSTPRAGRRAFGAGSWDRTDGGVEVTYRSPTRGGDPPPTTYRGTAGGIHRTGRAGLAASQRSPRGGNHR